MSRTRKSKNCFATAKAEYARTYRRRERRRVRDKLHEMRQMDEITADMRDLPDMCGLPDCPYCCTQYAADAGPADEAYFDHWAYD